MATHATNGVAIEATPDFQHQEKDILHADHEEDTGAGKSKLAGALTDTAPKDGDLGGKWMAAYTGERPLLDDEANTKIRNRIDAFLLPLIFLIYFNQQLDKSAVSFAAVFSFRADAGLVGAQYSWLTTIIYIAQLVFQPLSVYALVRFKVNHWIIFCFIGWSASCLIMASLKSFVPLLVLRFILGAFEASIAPTMMILVSGWWTRREQPLRNNLWYSANGIALILGSLIAFGLGHVTNGPLYRYQLIFLTNGAIGIVSVIPVFFFLPSHITTARFLSPVQKYLALERIRLNNTGTQNTTFKWSHVRECLLDLKQWGFVLMVFCVSFVSGGIGAFGPLIIAGFGFSPYQTILFNMIPGAIGIAANLITAFIAIKLKRKGPVILGILVFPVAAAAALYALPRDPTNTNLALTRQLLAVYFILQIFQPLTPLIFSWTFANTAGHTKKTTTTAMLFIGLCVGNMIGPQLYFTNEAPYYRTGLIANMVVLIVMFGIGILQIFYLMFLNRVNVKRRAALGKTGVHVDYSLENSKNWAKMRENVEKDGVEEENEGGLDDKTDKENEDFIYSL